MVKRYTKEEFIKKARQVHGDKYNYDQVEYIDILTHVKIFCNRCKTYFIQSPHSHLSGCGCIKCNQMERDAKRKLTTAKFIEKAKRTHGNKYNYSETDYINNRIKVKIWCNTCKKYFWQNPKCHCQGSGCPTCGKIQKAISKTFSTEKYIKLAKKIHSNKYNYDKSIYGGMKNDIEIYCNKCHSYFWQNAAAHLKRHGCPHCATQETIHKNTNSFDRFYEQAIKIHNHDYDYSKATYINKETKIEIICNKCHKSFWQSPHSHLTGKGCPYCKQSKGEKLIKKLLEKAEVSFECQKRFKDCRDKKPLPFDFYIPAFNICIEYQGEQHYRLFYYLTMNKDTAQKDFELRQLHDEIKRKYCKEHGIKLLEIRYDESIVDRLKGIIE